MKAMIKIYPEIIFLARQKRLNLGAFKIWFIAKSIDSGNCNIPEKVLIDYLKSLGISKSRLYAWLHQAEAVGLLKRNGRVCTLASWQRGAAIAGVQHLLRAVRIPMHRLVHKHWLSWVWAGYLKHFEGNPIARKTLEKLTGVPERTQQSYEKNANVRHIENYADLGTVVGNPRLAIDLYDKSGHYQSGGRIRRRLGNTYITKEVQLAHRGRTSQVNSAVRSTTRSMSWAT